MPSILVTTASDLVGHFGTSLRDALGTANALAAAGTSETIVFDTSLAGASIALTQGQLELSGAGGGRITIDGRGLSSPLTVSGNNASRVFQVDTGVVAAVYGLVITAGYAPSSGEGGGISNSGDLTLAGNTIQNCYAYVTGAAVYNSGTLTMIGNTVSSNTVSGAAGGWGGAVHNSGTLTMSGNLVQGTSTGPFGNAMRQAGVLNGGSLAMSGDTIANNFVPGITSMGWGTTALIAHAVVTGNVGGINNEAVMTVLNTTLAGNAGAQEGPAMLHAYFGGGGIFNQGTLTVSGCTFSSNSAPVIGSNSGYGGGILNNGSYLTVTNSTFYANSAGADGGAIFNGSTSPSPGSLTVSNCTFKDNTAPPNMIGGIAIGPGPCIILNTYMWDTPWDLDRNPDVGSARNMIGTSNTFGTLADRGGPTQTIAPLSGSPALGAGGAVTSTAASITAGDTQISVALGTAIARTSGRFLIKIDNEVMLVTNASGNSLTVVRGYNGTTAAAHSGTVPVYLATDQRGYLVTGTVRDIGAYQTHTSTLAAGFASSSSTSFSLGTAGTFTVLASGYPLPALSLSGTDPLPAGVTFNPVTGVLSGTPAAGSGGSYTLHFTAHNGVGGDAVQTFTLTVNQPPAFTSASSTTFNAGLANSFFVTASGGPPPTLSISPTDVLPPGVTFNATTGLLGGSPVPGSGGVYTLHFTAHNGVGSDAYQTFTLTVNNVPLAPVFTSASSTTFSEGALGSFTVTVTGWPTPTLSLSGSDSLPSGVTFNNVTGLLSGTPAPGTVGSYILHFTATNTGGSALQTLTLTVNQAPVFTSPSSTTFTVGTLGSFTVTASGTPTPTLSLSGTLPSGVTFNATTGLLGGTPAPGTGGVYPVQFTAQNGSGSPAVQSFTLTVQQAPAFTSASSTAFIEGLSGSFTVVATGWPVPTLSQSGSDSLPGGVTFHAATGVLSGTPALGSAGTYPLHFTAQNGVGSPALQTFTLTVASRCLLATGSEAGHVPQVNVYDGNTGTLQLTFLAYPASFTGGVRVAVGDVNADGMPDIITAPGKGLAGSTVQVFDGRTGTQLASFNPFPTTYKNGSYVAVGNFDSDPLLEVVCGKSGGGLVRTYDVSGGTGILVPGPLRSFYPYGTAYISGVTVAAGDYDGVGTDELITGKAKGTAKVLVFGVSGTKRVNLANFLAQPSTFTGGIYVAAGDLTGDGKADIVVGPASKQALNVKAFSGGNAAPLAAPNVSAYGAAFTGGVRVALLDLDGNGVVDRLVTAPGAGRTPEVREFNLAGALLDAFFAYETGFLNGVFVGG